MNSDPKWYIVTGASSGIGRSIATTLLNRGKNVVLTSRTVSKLEDTVRDYTNDRYRIIPWDLSDLSSLNDYAKTVKSQVGVISGLVHSAGTQKTIPLAMTTKDRIDEVFNLNSFAAMILVSLFSKNGYFNNEGTSFVLISSMAAHEGAVGKAIYGASKGAIEGFMLPAAAELVSKKIRLNALIAGIVETPLAEQFLSKSTEEQRKALEKSYPLGFGEPEDIAEFAAFLLEDTSKWITGQKFVIDGGHTVRAV